MIAFLFDVYLPILFLLVWSKSLFELLQRMRVAEKKTPHSLTKCMPIPSGNSCALGSGENANREAVELVRQLVGRIDATPSQDRARPMGLDLMGKLAALLEGLVRTQQRYRWLRGPATAGVAVGSRAEKPFLSI